MRNLQRQMPNKNYIKGIRKERKLVNQAKTLGMLAFRSAGSHSPIDVCCIDKLRHEIHFIQSKPDNMSEKSKQALYEPLKWLNGDFKVFFEVR